MALVYAMGGAGSSYHLAYLPIILAGFLFYRVGGLVMGAAAGLLLGPLMPFNALVAAPQEPASWLSRLVFFVLAGLLTGQLALLLRQHMEQLNDAYVYTLYSFASLVAVRDEQVNGHCERTADNSRTVGAALGLTGRELQALYQAGFLHDVGKVAIPDRILLKAGPLTEQEFQTVRSHTALGADLVSRGGEEFTPVAQGIRTHHERWDGTGYPASLQGSDIPLFGRILGVIEVFEALTSERPYRKPVGIAQASELLRREAGGHFDPDVVEQFLELLAQGKIAVADELPDAALMEKTKDVPPSLR